MSAEEAPHPLSEIAKYWPFPTYKGDPLPRPTPTPFRQEPAPQIPDAPPAPF